jgi:hypothetical protein
MNCKIEITETLNIDKGLDYKIKELNFFQTLRKDEPEFVNQEKLEILVNAMKNTHLKNSLSDFRYYWKQYPLQEVKKIFDKHDFMITISSEKQTPNEESA